LKPTKQSSNLDGRRRNANGEIDRKQGNTVVRTLRDTYGEDFAADCRAGGEQGTVRGSGRGEDARGAGELKI
jgi:hypothetical protein